MYVDTCVIAKLLVNEPDSGFFSESLKGKPLSSSELAYTETLSALLARERAGTLSIPERHRAWRRFLGWLDSGEIRLEALNFIVLKKAAQSLEWCHPEVPLRTLDAIHLATVDLNQDFPLATTDKRMRAAAAALAIPVFPTALEDIPLTP